MPNVIDAFDLIEHLENNSIVIHRERCVALRHIKSSCKKCVEACPIGCISVANHEVTIDEAACIGCGVCANVCPTEALVAEAPSDEDLLLACSEVMQATNNKCAIVCKPMLIAAKGLFDPEKVVGVGCLGRIDESILVLAAKNGASEIKLVKGDCSLCEHHSGIHMAETVCAEAKMLLNAVGDTTQISIVSKFPACTKKAKERSMGSDRRGFFFGMKDEAKTAFVKTAQYATKKVLNVEEGKSSPYIKITETGSLPQYMPERNMRLLDELDPSFVKMEGPLTTRLWGNVRIDREKCTVCQMCTTFCPTGALAKINEEENIGLAYTAAYCVQCKCCADICPNKAISVSNQVDLRSVLQGKTKRRVKKLP